MSRATIARLLSICFLVFLFRLPAVAQEPSQRSEELALERIAELLDQSQTAGRVSRAALRGKVVVLAYWASW